MQTTDYFKPAGTDVLVRAMEQLKTAFPGKKDTFFELLAERIIANGFTAAEVLKIVDNAIDTIRHNDPTIGEIIHEARRKRQENIVE
jgi:hypothetical protein